MESVSIFDFPYIKYLLFVWGIFSILCLTAYVFKKKVRSLSFVEYLLGNGLISMGVVTGVIMGNNRNPISDTIMSSVFALVGTVITFMFFGKENPETDNNRRRLNFVNINNQFTIAIFLILFPVSLLYGAHIGSKYRLVNEELTTYNEFRQKQLSDSLEIEKKTQENNIQIQAMYYKAVYDTWSENEKKRYQKMIDQSNGKTPPPVPEYSVR